MSRPTNPNQQPLSLESQVDEDRVRRALGLKTNGPHQQRPEQARQRHRFVSDGAVPVVMLNRGDHENGGLKERLAAAETALETERAAHAATRRQLHDAQAANQMLQTRLGHAELAHNEALAAERDARRAADEALAAVRAELETVRGELETVRAELEPKPRRVIREAAPKPVRAARIPRLPKVEKEQKPVRWWTPSYRAKNKR
ncbi:MAG TPA: hypothetical protein VE650_08035 [Acetobacteraceae bacterium]|nr:hypothetical protein [Acetobacteraceae bacterium]